MNSRKEPEPRTFSVLFFVALVASCLVQSSPSSAAGKENHWSARYSAGSKKSQLGAKLELRISNQAITGKRNKDVVLEIPAASLADLDAKSDSVTLLSIGDTLSGTAKTYSVPVDSTLTSVTFSASGTTSVALKRPDNSTVQSTDPGVSFIGLSTGSVYSITSPPVGNWTITVNGTGAFSISVTGESPLDLTSFRFAQVEGRPGHQGLFPIPGFPSGPTGNVDAVVEGAFNTAQFSLRSKAGALLQTLTLSQGTGNFANEFVGTTNVPSTPFVAYVTGTDGSGASYQRVLPGTFQSETVQITPPLDQDLVPGVTNSYVFQVQNLGASDTFAISAIDDKGYIQLISPTSVTLSTNQSANVTIQLQAPSTATPGTSDTLTFTATGSVGTRSTNFAVLTNFVGFPTTAPVINAISPTAGTAGTTVTITGTGFRDSQGASTVTFNSTSAGAASSWSATSITVQVPTGATTGNVIVTVGGVASNGKTFSVIAMLGCPAVTGLSPMSGPVGTSVTVTGTTFGSTQGSSVLLFNGTAANPKKWSDTSILAPVPAGATTGEVVVKLNSSPPRACDPYGVVFTVQ